MFSAEQIKYMQGKIREIFDAYEAVNGKRSKAPEAIRGEIQKCLSNLTDKERSLLPEDIQTVEYFSAAAEDLRKFGRGYPDNGVRRYNEFNSVKLRGAVAIYLSHPLTQKKYALRVSNKKLGLDEQDNQMALLLGKAFNSSSFESECFSSKGMLKSTYKGEARFHRAFIFVELNFISQVDDVIYYVTLRELRKPLNKSRDVNRSTGASDDVSTVNYEGWVIVTERQGLFFYANNMSTGDVEYFTLLESIKAGAETTPMALIFYQASAAPGMSLMDDERSVDGYFEEYSANELADNLLKLLKQ